MLEGAGQLALAYVCAANHGLTAEAARLRGYLEEANLPVPPTDPTTAQALLPPTPIIRGGGSWPTQSAKVAFDPAAIAAVAAAAQESAGASASSQVGWSLRLMINADCNASCAQADAAAKAAAAVVQAQREAEAAEAAAAAAERAAAGEEEEEEGAFSI